MLNGTKMKLVLRIVASNEHGYSNDHRAAAILTYLAWNAAPEAGIESTDLY